MYWGAFSKEQEQGGRLKRHPQAVEMPKGEMFLAAITQIVRAEYGFVKAVDEGTAQDAKGQPLPLFTYPAIEYLQQFDYRQKRVFEFGAGGSTKFWMQRAQQVMSVENNAQWVQKLKPELADNVTLLHVDGDDFPWTIEQYQHGFDVIIVDSAGYRYDCASAAIGKLNQGGMIILDNADWHPNTAKFLREQGLIEVDFTGFKPGECHSSTTSVFLHRDFNFTSLAATQPSFGMGAKWIHSEAWDKPYARRQK
ncbi:SAM-dependent methyltransferase [Pseudidiomarina sp. WS423]|uniref:SAM-dependent methyltransferase n=1 Tax=Pseudidiomarina sp. WS423 TaxID=3425124 RepID=UPI003D6E4E79